LHAQLDNAGRGRAAVSVWANRLGVATWVHRKLPWTSASRSCSRLPEIPVRPRSPWCFPGLGR